jgi:hypothetical protein
MPISPTLNDDLVKDGLPSQAANCPISALLGARVSEMDDAQLAAFVTQTRSARETPAVLKTLLRGKDKKSTTKKAAPKVDMSLFGL